MKVLRSLVFLVAAAMSAAAARAQALEKLTVQMAFYPQGPQAYLFVAKDRGLFAKYGLDVDMLDGRGSAYSMQVLMGGHADIGEGQLSPLASAREKGAKVKAIAEWYAKDGPAIIAPADSDIRGPADLKGKKVVLIASGPWPPLIDSFFAQFGLKQSDMELMYVDSAALFTTYAAKRADAMLSVELAFTEADPMRASRLIPALDYGVKLPGDGIYVSEDVLRSKRDVLRRFLLACGEAVAYTFDGHEDEAARAIVKINPATKLSVDHLRDQIVHYGPLRASFAGKPPGWQSAEDWAERVSYMRSAGVLKSPHEGGEFFTNELFEPAGK